MADLEMKGCRTKPLISYLKSLGLLRIIALQKDEKAKGYWGGETFRLICGFDIEEILDFIVDEYQPTPIISPWNSGSGFYRGANPTAIRTIESIKEIDNPRLAKLQQSIAVAEKGIRLLLGAGQEYVKEKKKDILGYCRNYLPDEALPWLDAAYALSIDAEGVLRPAFPHILGTGGNDGRMEFSVNFLQRILDVIDSEKRDSMRDALFASLLGESDNPHNKNVSVGFFHPGGVGGPNATEGYEGDALVNPWDFILMMEGVVILAGSVARRMDVENLPSTSTFPFSVTSSSAGIPSSSQKEEKTGGASRGETWLPVWPRPTGIEELSSFFSEGRAIVGKRSARDGLDFSRAAASLGVSRGVDGFVRYGFFQRSGKAYIAIPTTYYPVRDKKPAGIDLVAEIDPWLERAKALSRNEDCPESARQALRAVQQSIFDYTLKTDHISFQRVLIALGRADYKISQLSNIDMRPAPLTSMSNEWIKIAYDESPEFRVALSLASIGWTGSDMEPIRLDIEPLEYVNTWARWTNEEGHVIHLGENPLAFLASILVKRCLAGKKEERDTVPIGSLASAALEDVDSFLRGDLDEHRIVGLSLGLMTIRWPNLKEKKKLGTRAGTAPPLLPRDYILLKALFMPEGLWMSGERVHVPSEISVLALLRGGRLRDACRAAERRLRGAGLIPLDVFGEGGVDPLRLLASLLIPVDAKLFSYRALPLIIKSDHSV